jgi:hypothetical protein
MEKPRFQFTFSRALLATFWMAACFGSLAALSNAHRDGYWPDSLYEILALFAVDSPFIAVGVLCQRVVMAAIIGFVAWLILVPLLMPPFQ